MNGKEKYLAETTTDCTENVVNRNIINKQKEEMKAIIDNKDVYEQAEYFDIDGKKLLYEQMPKQRVIRGEKITGYIVIAKNKNGITYTEVTGTPIFDAAGEFIGGVMIYHDITIRVKNQGNLLQKTQSKSLMKIINNLELGCAIASYPDFKIKYINNKSYIRLKKINPEISLVSLVEKNIFDMFGYSNEEKDKIENKFKKSINNKSNSYFYHNEHINEKEEKYFKIMCQALSGLDDVITEEVKAKNKIKETLKIQDEIFSNISHELKTPLNLIFSTNQLMKFYLNNNLFESNKDKVSKT